MRPRLTRAQRDHGAFETRRSNYRPLAPTTPADLELLAASAERTADLDETHADDPFHDASVYSPASLRAYAQAKRSEAFRLRARNFFARTAYLASPDTGKGGG